MHIAMNWYCKPTHHMKYMCELGIPNQAETQYMHMNLGLQIKPTLETHIMLAPELESR